MKKITIALAAVGCALVTGAAQAGNVHWSIGISLPPVGTVISNVPAPVYAPAAVYVPAPVYVEPAPVYYVAPPRVVYRPAPVYVAPPVVYRPVPAVVYATGYHRYPHDRRDEYGTPYREGRWVPADPRRQHHDR
ncbi:hypothetical protein [Piscinibacter sp. XHJ-5]|uniref:hypothetical protein n=1 Tax=Piscinibacter sp. XHJ-5 TaxID=3037797 RepID=UPI0024532290|nr:hypothetical protein [Piscinibacter sp. XHJ-5]